MSKSPSPFRFRRSQEPATSVSDETPESPDVVQSRKIADVTSVHPTLTQLVAASPVLREHVLSVQETEGVEALWKSSGCLPRFGESPAVLGDEGRSEDVRRNAAFLSSVVMATKASQIFDRAISPHVPSSVSATESFREQGVVFVERQMLSDVLTQHGRAAFEATAALVTAARHTREERDKALQQEKGVVAFPQPVSESSSHQKSVDRNLKDQFFHHLRTSGDNMLSGPQGYLAVLHDSAPRPDHEGWGTRPEEFSVRPRLFGRSVSAPEASASEPEPVPVPRPRLFSDPATRTASVSQTETQEEVLPRPKPRLFSDPESRKERAARVALRSGEADVPARPRPSVFRSKGSGDDQR